MPVPLDPEPAAHVAERWLARNLASGGARVALEKAPNEKSPDLIIDFEDGSRVALEIKALSHPSATEIERLAQAAGRRHGRAAVLVVADQLSESARKRARALGLSYLDRRGEAYVREGDVRMIVHGDAIPRPAESSAGFPSGAGGLAVALVALLRPSDTVPVNAVARAAGLTNGAVSQSRRRLQQLGLLDRTFRAVPSVLFDAAAEALARARPSGSVRMQGVRLVHAANSRSDQLVDHGWPDLGAPGADPARFEGPALGGAEAAIAHGAPLAMSQRADRTVYLPDEGMLERVLSWERGDAPSSEPEADGRVTHLTVAPTRLMTRLRRSSPRADLPLVHPLVTALELASDPGRGRQALEAFMPAGVERVW